MDEDENKDEDAPAWAKHLSKDMGKILEQMTSVNLRVDEAVNISKEAKTAAEHTQADMKNLKEDYGAFQAQVGTTIAETVRVEVDKAMSAQSKMGVGKDDSDADEVHPERLVIVSGWPMDTPAETIIEKLHKFVTDNFLEAKVVEVFCFSDPAMSGVLKFRSEASRNAFLRASRRMKGNQIDDDRQMKFSKKLTVLHRAAEKRLGYIKHAVMTKMKADRKEVKINWTRHTIEYKSEQIFKTKKDGERIYDGVGKEVSKEVEAKVEEWLKKRMSEDSD